MRAQAIIHKLFTKVIHARRLHVLGQVVETVLCTKKMMLTHLGRHLVDDKTQERSSIRKVDRLVGNVHLLEDKKFIHQVTVNWLVGNNKQPHIIIDWSKYPGAPYTILRAAVVRTGRALTLYEELHPKAQENCPDIHDAFLKTLAFMLPADCRPVILLDAGFSVPMLKVITQLGYDYVVRVRGQKMFRRQGSRALESIRSLIPSATNKIQTIGEVVFTRANPWLCQLHMVKLTPRDRHAYRRGAYAHLKHKRIDKMSDCYARNWKEPWILATSLCGEDAGRQAVEMYAQRMTIEEAFRDLKSHQYGFGLSTSKTKKKSRCEVLLLLSMIATFIAWCIGYIAESKGWHKQFQANSIDKKRVLSLVYLGCAVIRRRLVIPWWTIVSALKQASMPCYEVDYV